MSLLRKVFFCHQGAKAQSCTKDKLLKDNLLVNLGVFVSSWQFHFLGLSEWIQQIDFYDIWIYFAPTGLIFELAFFLQIFTRRCRLKKLQSSKIFVARKLRAYP